LGRGVKHKIEGIWWTFATFGRECRKKLAYKGEVEEDGKT